MDRKVLEWCWKSYLYFYHQSTGLNLSLLRKRRVFPERADPEGFLTGMLKRHTG